MSMHNVRCLVCREIKEVGYTCICDDCLNRKEVMRMAPTGTPVQYINEDGHVMAATVVEDWSEDMKNLKVHLDGSNSSQHGFTPQECEQGWAWRTSIHRGDGPNNWRPLPREGP